MKRESGRSGWVVRRVHAQLPRSLSCQAELLAQQQPAAPGELAGLLGRDRRLAGLWAKARAGPHPFRSLLPSLFFAKHVQLF